MKKSLFLIAMLFILTSMFAVLLNEGFEGTTFPPADWTTSPTAWQVYTAAGYTHTGAAATKSGYTTGTWWLMTPQLTPAAGANTLTFWYRDYSESTAWDYDDEYTYVMVSTTDNATGSFATTLWTGDYLQFTTTWQQATIDLSAYNGQNIYIAFKSVHTGGNYRIVDDVTGVDLTAGAANDLQAVSVTGPASPSVGALTPYVVTVRNRGTVAQTTYTVDLMSGTTVLASVPGTAIQPLEELPITVNYAFTAEGSIDVFGKVNLTGDQNPTNNQSLPLNIVVQPAGQIVIGTGTTAQRQPFGVLYDYERSAAIYTSAEINTAGLVTDLKWYCNTVNTNAVPYKIYLKNTTESVFTSVPFATLIADATLMQDATITFGVTGWTTFHFTTPFMYTGSNLMVLVESNIGAWILSGPQFRYTAGTAGMHQYWNDDDAPPPDNGTLSANRPNIALLIQSGGMGSISGTVTSGGNPLEGATVTVEGTQLTATTSAAGTYNFPYVSTGQRQVICSKIGYQMQTLPATVVENQNSTVDFVMVALPQVNVIGQVFGSDAPTAGLVGANVELTGMTNYTATTNATGNFTIAGVYTNQAYNYVISKTGYAPATGTITVGITEYDMGSITLSEVAYPAMGVQAVEAAPNVNITWMEPNPNPVSFSDGFETYTDFSLEFAPWTTVDVDFQTTYGIQGITFLHSGEEMAYIIFNPSATTPAITSETYLPHNGAKYAACIASETPPNNDWLISPATLVPGNGIVKFWARSLVATYGLERFKVGVSTTGTAPANFTIISGASYIQAPITWTEYTYQLNAYAGQEVHIGIQCVSNDAFIFLVDDFYLGVPPVASPFVRSTKSTPMHFDSYSPQNEKVASGNTHRTKLTPAAIRTLTSHHYNNSERPLVGYKVWRLLAGQEDNEAAWTLLTPNVISATAYPDAGWNDVTDGTYKWAVKAAYSNNVMAPPAISNAIAKITQIGTITGIVSGPNSAIIAGATITAGTYTATSNATGAYSMTVPAGIYSVVCTATGYVSQTQNDILVVNGEATQVNFNLAVSNLVTDGFETYSDFSVDFPPWTNNDIDGSTTYGFQGITFPGTGEAMSFIVFNPATTTPPLTTLVMHGGTKLAACFASETPDNNDWLISESYSVGAGAKVSFWAKSYTAQYGLERFKVGVSNGSLLPNQFTIVTGANYIQAPVEWTYYEYNIPANLLTGNVRVGINCISSDAFIFMVDDYVMDKGLIANEDPIVPVIATALNGNYPNPFNPETSINYSVKGNQPVVVEIYNTKGQKVKTLVNETKATGNYSVKWNGTDDNNHKVTSGVYFYKMNAGKYSASKKMILMK